MDDTKQSEKQNAPKKPAGEQLMHRWLPEWSTTSHRAPWQQFRDLNQF